MPDFTDQSKTVPDIHEQDENMSPSPNYQFYTEQALGIHGNYHFWHHVITVVLK